MRYVNHVFSVWHLLFLCHALGQVGDLKVGCSTWRHNQCLLASEVSLAECALSANRRIDGPFTILRVLNGYCLRYGFAYNCLEVKFLCLRSFVCDTFAHHGQFNGFTTCDCAENFLGDAGVNRPWVESHFQVKVGVRVDIALGRRNREILELRGVPLKVCLYIAEVAHLKCLRQAAILHNLSERDDLIHDLKLDSVSCTIDRE